VSSQLLKEPTPSPRITPGTGRHRGTAERADLDSFDRQQRRSFVRRYDADGDDEVGATDLEAFLIKHNRGDEEADLNRDGRIDKDDIDRFRDMMIRSP